MNSDRDRQIVSVIAAATSDAEKVAISDWARQMLIIRNNNFSVSEKAKQAIFLTMRSKIIFPVIKTMACELKKIGWDNRGWSARLGIVGATLGMVLFGGQGAGIAALGTAIGVPLWVVFGSGAAFAGVLIEELARNKQK